MSNAELPRRAAEAILRRVAPSATLTEVIRRTGGELSGVHELRCAEPVIVKVYPEEWDYRQDKEVHVYRTLARHGVGPVPEVLHVERAGGLLDEAFTVLSRIPGVPMSEVSAGMDEAEHRGLYRGIGEFLAAVHDIGQDGYGEITTEVVDPAPANTPYMTRRFARSLALFDGDPELRRGVESYVAERVGLFASCAAPVLCHNDLHEGNVLVAEGPNGWAVTGFVDVENAIAADPLIDIAKTDYYSILGVEAKLTGLLEGYGPLPDDWRERVAVYSLHHALELWCFHSIVGNTRFLPDIAGGVRRRLARP
ncbi:phosphotransferase family protein [Umezawaea endophytica]|uniref:Aminoglycoside phosphotransferase family protein n=1 Tax=Umezawaea endophytica TaxID=1654476 RepID=A0A9X2VTB4_9PSEU|nr:aminoglycoside phosphotransferase family protein [Umezawaea endophytica]MCS7481749.1 aminoglycoside phosphotransferase family protein [Umezawaea endophytica]